MARLLAILSGILILDYANSQIIRSPLSLLNRPLTEAIFESQNYNDKRALIEAQSILNGPQAYIDDPRYLNLPFNAVGNFMNIPDFLEPARNFLQPQPTIIAEPSYNGILPVIPNVPSTAIITDCTPSVCKNLADTINLMIVSNLIQNSVGGEKIAMQLATPLLKEIILKPGFANRLPFNANTNLVAPDLIAANVGDEFNIFAPNVPLSSAYTSRIIGPTNIVPNAPISKGRALLSNLLSILGGVA